MFNLAVWYAGSLQWKASSLLETAGMENGNEVKSSESEPKQFAGNQNQNNELTNDEGNCRGW